VPNELQMINQERNNKVILFTLKSYHDIWQCFFNIRIIRKIYSNVNIPIEVYYDSELITADVCDKKLM
jgi:hypothetical protein